MTHEHNYHATEYGDGHHTEAVALVTGLAGKTTDLDQAARDLATTGRDSIIYTYPPDVLLSGDPALLPQLVDQLSADFAARTADYPRHRFAGVSLGGAIAANMQKQCATPERGLYAASGSNAARLIMKNWAFRAIIQATHHHDVRRAYQRQGYDLDSLNDAWHEFHTPPVTAFTLAMGGLDLITRRRDIRKNVTNWRTINPHIHLVELPYRDHSGTIRWYNQHIHQLLHQPTEPRRVTYS